MVGGEPEALERVRPALEAMGELIVYAGPVGQGQTVKLVNNAVAAINAVVVAEALVVATRQGADLDALLAVMGPGSGGSMMLELKGRPMVTHHHELLFKTEHMLKDVRLALAAADAAGGGFASAAMAQDVLSRAVEMGLGDEDFGALAGVLESDHGIRIGDSRGPAGEPPASPSG
jgi:3-hydroxyisobutyrate dehydrogenase-like beta-hydroxyacid dehydrogenase